MTRDCTCTGLHICWRPSAGTRLRPHHRRAEWGRLHRAGWTPVMIARQHGVTPSAVYIARKANPRMFGVRA